MTPERWAQTKDILAQALAVPAADRAALIDRACGTDTELRVEVASLLSAAGEDQDSLPKIREAIASMAASALDPKGHGAQDTMSDAELLSLLETALGQQYEIVRPLGRGGMGAVYLARERALERFVAIKVLRPDLAIAAENRERFRREARVVAQLSHPNILPLHTFGEVRGVWYFVMGYVRGVTLADRLRSEGRLPSGEAHRILMELADAVDSAHRQGVIHRDIKPANILLDEETGRAMLADFGISKVAGSDDSLTASGMVVGTPHFMSPEQSVGSPAVDERSDIYSLGAVGYTMLVGREPFAGVSAQELTRRRLSHDPVPLTVAAPGVPEELASVVTRCLARQPTARWPDARSLRAALARTIDGDGSALPEGIRDLPSFGPYAVLWVAGWMAVALRSTREPGDRALLMLIALLVPLGFLLHLWNVGRHEGDTAHVARVAFWPPEWWGMWWPSALRRPSDLWHRLPWPARAVRSALSTFIVVLPTMILLRPQVEEAIRPLGRSENSWFVELELLLILVAAAITAGALAWAYRKGLTRAESVRVLFGATTPSPGWTAPRVARLLAPAKRRSVQPPDPDSARDHQRAIGEVVRTMPLSTEVVDRVQNLAQSLARELENLDSQIELLSRDANSREVDRLTAQLSALETENSSAVERRELIDLVRQQLEVVRRMRIRCEALSQRRTMLFGLMRGLWTRLDHMREDTPRDGEPSLDTRANALCDDVNRSLLNAGSE